MSYATDKAKEIAKNMVEMGASIYDVSTCDYRGWDRELHFNFPQVATELKKMDFEVSSTVNHGVTDWVVFKPANTEIDLKGINEFKEKGEELLSQFEDLIHTMPEKGNTSSECQRVCLQQHLSELWSALNGTEAEDLIEEE